MRREVTGQNVRGQQSWPRVERYTGRVVTRDMMEKGQS